MNRTSVFGNENECMNKLINVNYETVIYIYYFHSYIYRIRVQAVNGIGVGAFSSPVKVTTRPLPPNPSRLECVSYAPNSLKLKWGDGRNLDLLTYTLEMEKEDGK